MMKNLAILLLLLTLAGCGKELLAGEQGDVEVEATDQPPQQQPSSGLAPNLNPAPEPLAQVVPVLAGTVEFEATVSLEHTSGDIAAVTTTPVSATLPVGGNESIVLARRRIPGGRYTIVRIDFTRVRATLTAGPGVVDTKVVDVDIGQQPYRVEKLVDLVVGVTNLERLQINLNTSTWVLLEQGGLVDPVHFANAVQARVNP